MVRSAAQGPAKPPVLLTASNCQAADPQAAASRQRTSTERSGRHGDRHPALVGENRDEERPLRPMHVCRDD